MPSLYGTVQLGRMTLLDADFEAAIGGDGTVKLTVQASPTNLGSNTAVERRGQDLLGLNQQLIPVVFSDKTPLTGFYRVNGVDLTHWSYPGNVGPRRVVATAQLDLQRIGPGNAIDIESRLAGAKTRANDHHAVGDIWHAPAVGHSGYHVAGGHDRAIVRYGEDGPLFVYRGLAAWSAPRWSVTPQQFGGARVRFLDGAGDERSGVAIPFEVVHTGGLYPTEDLYPGTGLYPDAGAATGNTWTVSNGLVKVTPAASGLFTVAHWAGGAWHAKTWDVQINGGSLNPVTGIDLIENTYDTVVLRLFTGLQPGRVTVDLRLRRGSRFVEMYVQASYQARLAILRTTAEAATAHTGWIAATADDTDGHRYIAGSARTFTPDTSVGGLRVAAATQLDAFLGAIVDGGDAVEGDSGPELLAQYLGTPSEQMSGIRR